MRAERISERAGYHLEGPVWSESWGGLRCMDMLDGAILTRGTDGAISRRVVGQVAALTRPRRGGGSVIAIEDRVLLESAEGDLRPLLRLLDDPAERLNEGACAPDGSLFVGSMAYNQTAGGGQLFRVSPGGTSEVVLAGVGISNGLDWAPDGSTAYYNDTLSGRTDVFDYDSTAGLINRRTFVDFRAQGLLPDGLVVDREGHVWIALFNGASVRCYDERGRLLQVVEVGAHQVTACTFGGSALDELYITTSRENVADGDDPGAGSLFLARVGTSGLPVREFAG